MSWKICLKNYLVGNGLWGVVSNEKSEEEDEEWKKKNALALHAIQLSCGRAIYSKFKKANITAHEVWTKLAQERLISNHDVESGVKDNGPSEDSCHYGPLYKAIEEGKWHDLNKFFEEKKLPLSAIVSSHKETALHMATLSKQTEIAKQLLISMEPQDLELTNEYGATALSLAVICGLDDLAMEMVNKNEKLVIIEIEGHENGHLPVIMAALYEREDMVRYLYNKMPKHVLITEKGEKGATLLNCLITAQIYDVALLLVERYPQLVAIPDGLGNYALKILAQRPTAFLSGTELAFWERWIYNCVRVHDHKEHAEMQTSSNSHDHVIQITESNDKDPKGRMVTTRALKLVRRLGWGILQFIVPKISNIHQKKVDKLLNRMIREVLCSRKGELNEMDLDKIIYDAIEHGIIEFIEEMIKCAPDIIWRKDKKGRTIFANAILLRQEKIFGLIFTIGIEKSLIGMRHDVFENNYLHLVAKLSPPSRLQRITGAALQMQRELQWFKEVERIVSSKLKEELNGYNKKPETLFRDEHEELAKEAESWMKNTATSSMIVGTLIAAVMFTTAFTVPGGNKNETGMPTMLETQRVPFLIFIISNALSLFSSTATMLIFLGILTARYAEEDFLKSLPVKLIFGLTCLFLSIVTMMASFSAALYLILHENLSWVNIPIIVLTTIPIVLFSSMQFPLLIEMTNRTYGAGIFDKPKKKSHFAKFRTCLAWTNLLRKKRN